METKPATGAKRMSKKEFLAESARLLREAEGFLDKARRHTENTRLIGKETDQRLDELERRIQCWNN